MILANPQLHANMQSSCAYVVWDKKLPVFIPPAENWFYLY